MKLSILTMLVSMLTTSAVFASDPNKAGERTVASAEAVAPGDGTEQQTKTLQSVLNFLINDVLGSIDPAKTRGREVTGRDVLDAASEKLDGMFDSEPLVGASIRHALGSACHRLGHYEAAEPHFKSALEIRRQQLGEEHPDILTSMRMLGLFYFHQGR
ncbi:MAG: tetratricopeptide repeat protein, partial [Planctomycetota bacterium]